MPNILKAIKEKLTAKGLETSMTPFGYLLEFKIHVKGESLAKVWKSI
ncbi:MAG TPA: threonyl-tRNA synthetase editing domain-containing protein [Methanosarcina sp.]|nr:threonyl-tRNA synthetase editing domain-containing protein [Methanosarcina sp.]